MISPQNTQELKLLLEKNSLFLSKKMGQNFLIDSSALEKIVTAGNLSKKDTVIEIGAGIGTLTLELSKKAKKVIAIEKDKNLLPLLSEIIKETKNVEIINEDILSYKVKNKDYKVVANVPYYITSPIIRKFLEEKNPPKLLVLTVQKEVAQRITAKPPKMNLLAASVQFFAKPKIISHISPCSFYPQPKVTSSILSIIPYNREYKELQENFFLLAKAGFSHPRKQLKTNFHLFTGRGKEKLSLALEKMEGLGIDKRRRAETLSVEEWIILAKKINET
jgi:16S rRNA (adenine1518-N6/adenine1519-N6)-dimethyltransferase